MEPSVWRFSSWNCTPAFTKVAAWSVLSHGRRGKSPNVTMMQFTHQSLELLSLAHLSGFAQTVGQTDLKRRLVSYSDIAIKHNQSLVILFSFSKSCTGAHGNTIKLPSALRIFSYKSLFKSIFLFISLYCDSLVFILGLPQIIKNLHFELIYVGYPSHQQTRLNQFNVSPNVTFTSKILNAAPLTGIGLKSILHPSPRMLVKNPALVTWLRDEPGRLTALCLPRSPLAETGEHRYWYTLDAAAVLANRDAKLFHLFFFLGHSSLELFIFISSIHEIAWNSHQDKLWFRRGTGGTRRAAAFAAMYGRAPLSLEYGIW